jgi:hypothetical protein
VKDDGLSMGIRHKDLCLKNLLLNGQRWAFQRIQSDFAYGSALWVKKQGWQEGIIPLVRFPGVNAYRVRDLKVLHGCLNDCLFAQLRGMRV